MAADGWPRGSRRLQPPYRRRPGSGKAVCGAAMVSGLLRYAISPYGLHTLLRGPPGEGEGVKDGLKRSEGVVGKVACG